MKKIVTVLGVAALVGMNGCKLSDNAQRSADNSEKAANNSTNLLELNQTAFGDGRQGGTRASRVDALEQLIAAQSLEMKLLHAGSYYQSLEFQLFKGKGFREDDASKRDRLFQVAIADITKIIKDFDVLSQIDGVKLGPDGQPLLDADGKPIPNQLLPQILDPQNSRARSYAAMAMGMHSVSERQKEAGMLYGVEVVSFFDVLTKVLAQKQACEADPIALQNAPVYVYEGLKASADIEKLLQMRMNLMAGTALKIFKEHPPVSLVDPQDPAKGFKIIASAVHIRDVSERMGVALQTKGVLAKAGIAVPFYADVAAGMKQISDVLGMAIPDPRPGETPANVDPKLPGMRGIKETLKRLQ